MALYWCSLGLAIAASLLGQVLLKMGASSSGGFVAQLFAPYTVIGLAFYGGSALLYIIALRRLPMSTALPCTAISYVIIAAIGRLAFNEPLGAAKVVALALICIGVVILASAEA